MSFQQRKALVDLKEINGILFTHRQNILYAKKDSVLQDIKNETITYLQSLGFSVSISPQEHTISATYKGEMNLEITYSQRDQLIIGTDIQIDVLYLKQRFTLSLVLNRKQFSNILEDDLSQAIQAYTRQNAELEKLNGSDINGTYQLQLKTQNADLIVFCNITEALNHILEIC